MRATVTVAFKGVPDKEVYPKAYAPGDVVEGDLAREAIAGGFATEGDVVAPQPAPKPQPELLQPQSLPVTAVDIPSDWKTLKADQIIALAQAVSGPDVADIAAAQSVIEAELAARAKK